MKKQILILAFFVLAVLAGTNKSFGQMAASSTTPRPGTCASDALHPKAGQSYAYTVAIGNGETVAADGYTWWITKNPTFIVAGTGGANQASKLGVAAGQLIATTATGTNDGASIDITWSPEILAATQFQGDPTNWATASATQKTPTFVAVMANSNCTDNLQVYEINPAPSFTVDIANIDPTTNNTKTDWTDQAVEQCVDKVRGATYTANEVAMDYGTNTLYFEVISANFVTTWTPTFQIMTGSLNGDQTADISWYYTKADALAGTNPVEAAVTGQIDGAVIAGTTALTTASTNTTNGVSIFVRVVVHNNSYETTTDNSFALAVDGEDSTGQWDLVNSDCADPANADQNDVATHVITARPQINNAIAPAPAPSPDTFIPKN